MVRFWPLGEQTGTEIKASLSSTLKPTAEQNLAGCR
jgi:hypothetical protein